MAVQVFEGPRYERASAVLGYGTYNDIGRDTGIGNDTISSVRVAPFTSVTFYNSRDLSGNNLTIIGPKDVPDLSRYQGDLDNRISSAVVRRQAPDEATKMMCCTGQSNNCAEFVPGSAACNNVIATHCSGNMASPFCKSWCRNNTQLCDGAVAAYCAQNPSDPYCACITSPASKVANPKCVDRACILNGYITSSMKTAPCPAQVDCRMQVTLNNSGVQLGGGIPIQQNCGNTAQPPPRVTVVPQPDDGGFSTASIILIVLIFLFIVFLAVVLAIYGQQQIEGDDGADL